MRYRGVIVLGWVGTISNLLGEALEVEEVEEVEEAICSIVVTLQTIMKRRFGIREPDDGPDFVGDPAEAKKRALRSVARWRRSQD